MLSTWMLLSLVAALPMDATTDAPNNTAWTADYGQALAETRAEARPLLVVLDVPSDESQRINPELLSPESGAFPLSSYELCRIDASSEYGKKVAEVFRVSEFPHVAIIDKSGSVILRRLSGDVTADQWKASLTRHAEGLRAASRHTVAKPVTPGASYTVEPASAGYTVPSEVYSPKPYCPSCQLRNR